jgi:hypothetical protein
LKAVNTDDAVGAVDVVDAEVVDEKNIRTNEILFCKHNADDAFDCGHHLYYFGEHEPCKKMARCLDDRISAVALNILEDFITMYFMSFSIFPYFSARRSLVEDKADGPNRLPISTFIPTPSYDADDEDDGDDEEDEDNEDDNSQMNDSNGPPIPNFFFPSSSDAGSLSSNLYAGSSRPSSNNNSDEDIPDDDIPESADRFLKQELLHVHFNSRKRLVGPYRGRVSFAKDGHLVIDYKEDKHKRTLSKRDRLVEILELPSTDTVNIIANDYRRFWLYHEKHYKEEKLYENLTDNEEEVGSYNNIEEVVRLNDVKPQQHD